MAMLCAADQDPDEARAHLREALECDPNLPAARKLLARLGGK
jgi:Tfp pilus assembly protein PilF